MKKKIMLVDGNSIINRAFYAIPILTNKDNEYTNGVYGFLNIFFKLYDEEKPEYAAVAFDVHAPTFRHIKYKEYKGTRKSMPEELRPQIPLLKKLLNIMNIKTFEAEGFEADDILGTLAVKAENEGLAPIIVSGDRDMLQLASDNILIRIPKTRQGKTEVENYYAGDVLEKIGVTPKEYIDVKALMGDASDNIPGVPSIGEKTAVKIIIQYKDLETAISCADEVKPKKASENLKQYADQARFSRELAEICVTAPVSLDLVNMRTNDMFNEEAYNEIKRLNFKSMIGRFTEKSYEEQDIKVNVISSPENAKSFLDVMDIKQPVAYKLVFIQNKFIGISLAFGDNSAFIRTSEKLSEKEILSLFKVFFTDAPKITIDSKSDYVFLYKNNIYLENILFDAMLAGYIINPSKSSYNYDDLAFDFLNESFPSLEEITGKGKKQKKLEEISEQELCSYAVNNAAVLYRTYEIIKEKLFINNQSDLYEHIELPMAKVLAKMELTGIKTDKPALEAFGEMLSEHLKELTDEIYKQAGEEFNIQSPAQLGRILFEKLELRGSKKTKTGYSTSADVLEKLRNEHPIIQNIMDYRTYAKLKSTYVDGLLAVINPEDDKIHSTFNQTITTTGRISSTEPNLQNIPVRLPLGRNLRKVFVPSDDSYIFVDADYSQIELRILAHMADDERLIEAFWNNQDIHKITASQVFNTPFDEVTQEQRSNAKAVNFGIVYGISGYSLGEDLNITKREAEKYIKYYFETYPKIKQYLDSSVEFARQNGYAQTIFGRRRPIPEILTSNFFERAFGERVAMNMPIQGSAADIIKIAMVKVDKRLELEKLHSRVILQVHDELLLEVKRDELETVKTILKDEMQNCVKLKVPLEIDINTGENWYEAK